MDKYSHKIITIATNTKSYFVNLKTDRKMFQMKGIHLDIDDSKFLLINVNIAMLHLLKSKMGNMQTFAVVTEKCNSLNSMCILKNLSCFSVYINLHSLLLILRILILLGWWYFIHGIVYKMARRKLRLP